jgi:protein SCO1/2
MNAFTTRIRRRTWFWRGSAVLWVALLSVLPADPVGAQGGERELLEASQAALGRQVPEVSFIDSRGVSRRLSEFRGKPVLVSLIFTSCAHSCSVTTRYIDRVVRIARDSLGQDSFTMLTIGFDHRVDSPDAMRAYATRHGIGDPNWHFLSVPDGAGLDELMQTLGFYYQPSPRGFDHTVQVSVIDAQGVVYRQVYGEVFEAPQLVEPLKALVLGRPTPGDGLLARLGKRVRLLCTVYDARADRYHFDYSLFIGLLIGLLVLGGTGLWLVLEMRRRRTAA